MKQRIVEYSEDESKEDEDSDWTVETDEAAKTAASGGAIELNGKGANAENRRWKTEARRGGDEKINATATKR